MPSRKSVTIPLVETNDAERDLAAFQDLLKQIELCPGTVSVSVDIIGDRYERMLLPGVTVDAKKLLSMRREGGNDA